jgi:N-acyl-D-aspartate/D-glutamate deacylase
MKTEVTCAFRVSPASTRFLLATQKTKTGRFTVDALATDGGAMPRNFIVEKGTALVRMDMLSWEDYVRKTSTNPARIIGLKNKGHLGIGADADISVLEGTSGKTYAVISGGKIIMIDGVITGSGTTVITTARGKETVKQRGLVPYIVNLEEGWFYTGRPEK